MNVLPTSQRVQILRCLLEGNSLRSNSRITGAAKKTVEKLFHDAGMAAARIQDRRIRGLHCKRLELDEIWSFVYAKRKNVEDATART